MYVRGNVHFTDIIKTQKRKSTIHANKLECLTTSLTPVTSKISWRNLPVDLSFTNLMGNVCGLLRIYKF